jgi:HAD superfamily phosphoserine phosphatase-like hydrolase
MFQSQTAQSRPVAVFDLDGSFVREQLLVLLLRELAARGFFSPGAAADFHGLYKDFQDRKISFEVYDQRLIELFSKHIVGTNQQVIAHAAQAVAERHRDLLYTFSRELLAALRPTHSCITVTGAIREVVAKLLGYWGFEDMYATELEVIDGYYTGRDIEVHFRNKERALRQHFAKTGTDTRNLVALGDSMSDAPMLALATLPIAFNPNKPLRKAAKNRGWPIVIERKDGIYVIEGDACRDFDLDEAKDAAAYLLEKSGVCALQTA